MTDKYDGHRFAQADKYQTKEWMADVSLIRRTYFIDNHKDGIEWSLNSC